MYQEPRPSCVTVIGWAWAILGALMCLAAVMALLGSVLIHDLVPAGTDAPRILTVVPVLAIIQLVVGALGLGAAIQLLKFKAWARAALEALTWLALIFVIGFMAFWLVAWVTKTPANPDGPAGFAVGGAVMGTLMGGLYCVPLVIMVRYLRSPKVRSVLAAPPDPAP